MEQLAPAEIDAVLESVGFGFLGLARDDRPYVLPMSFGYDDHLYLQLNANGRKHDFITAGTPACLTVFRYIPATERSESVLVEGDLRSVADDETATALDALAKNATFGTDLSLWGVPVQDADPRLFVIEPWAVSGRRFGEGVPLTGEPST